MSDDCTIDAASYVAYDLIYSLISRISSRAFVGAPTCYDETWTRTVNAFPMDVEKVKFALLIFPSFARSWIVPLLPHKWRLTRDHRQVRTSCSRPSSWKCLRKNSRFLNSYYKHTKIPIQRHWHRGWHLWLPLLWVSHLLQHSKIPADAEQLIFSSSTTHQWRLCKQFIIYVQCRSISWPYDRKRGRFCKMAEEPGLLREYQQPPSARQFSQRVAAYERF